MLTMKGKQQHYNVMMNNTKSWSPYSCVGIERAFAEDAGGCMWPPRSYTCGFCRREFTSAQALGGHMNVHRRDRAMLSQSLNPNYNYFSAASRVSSSGAKVEELAYHHNHDLSLGLSCKRPRLAVSPSPSSSSPPLKACFGGVEVLGFRASSMEELDLELRLGHDRPVVK